MCVYIYMYIHIYTHTNTHTSCPRITRKSSERRVAPLTLSSVRCSHPFPKNLYTLPYPHVTGSKSPAYGSDSTWGKLR